MREVILYIAMSLDGYIADKQSKVDWLTEQNPESQEPDSYSSFLQEIDTVIMGWNTYHQIVTELSPGQWVYEGLDCYVLTHRELPDNGQTHFTCQPVTELVEERKQRPGKNIWICGGADSPFSGWDGGKTPPPHLHRKCQRHCPPHLCRLSWQTKPTGNLRTRFLLKRAEHSRTDCFFPIVSILHSNRLSSKVMYP